MRAPNYQIFLDAQHIGTSDRGTTFETEHVRRDRKRLPGQVWSAPIIVVFSEA